MRTCGKTAAEIRQSSVYQGFQIRDGHGIVFVSSQGDIYPSGFLPVRCGNVRTNSLVDVYRQSPLFQALHSRTIPGTVWRVRIQLRLWWIARTGLRAHRRCAGERSAMSLPRGTPIGIAPALVNRFDLSSCSVSQPDCRPCELRHPRRNVSIRDCGSLAAKIPAIRGPTHPGPADSGFPGAGDLYCRVATITKRSSPAPKWPGRPRCRRLCPRRLQLRTRPANRARQSAGQPRPGAELSPVGPFGRGRKDRRGIGRPLAGRRPTAALARAGLLQSWTDHSCPGGPATFRSARRSALRHPL